MQSTATKPMKYSTGFTFILANVFKINSRKTGEYLTKQESLKPRAAALSHVKIDVAG